MIVFDVQILYGHSYGCRKIQLDKNVTTTTGAYALVQKELGLASSIGADGSTQATVAAAVKGSAATNTEGKMVFGIKKGHRFLSASWYRVKPLRFVPHSTAGFS